MKCFSSGLTKFLQSTPIDTALYHSRKENGIPVDYALLFVLTTVFQGQKVAHLEDSAF
jgi:hypothetical protein